MQFYGKIGNVYSIMSYTRKSISILCASLILTAVSYSFIALRNVDFIWDEHGGKSELEDNVKVFHVEY
jgi:hypothetical protein